MSSKQLLLYLEKLLNEDYEESSIPASPDSADADAIDLINLISKKNMALAKAIKNVNEGKLVAAQLNSGSQKTLTKEIHNLFEALKEKDHLNMQIKQAFDLEKKKLIEEDFIKSEYAKIFSNLQGVKTIKEFGEIFIRLLSKATNAQVGLIYVADYLTGDKSEKMNLEAVGYFGMNPKDLEHDFKSNPGLVSQCAQEKEELFLNSLSVNSFVIDCGMAMIRPKNILLFPILHEGNVLGVVQLAFISDVLTSHLRLVRQVVDSIGVSIQNISQMMLTDRLYSEIAQKNYSLDSQKQALDSSAIVAETDTKGKITYVNDKLTDLSKYSKEELLGQDHRILNSGHHSKDFFKKLWHTIKKGKVWTGEVKNKAKDGTFYWVDTTIYPVKDEEGNLQKFVAIRFDITERKKIEEELIHASQKARRATEVKSSFLANMSHEIRTPLNGILGCSNLLLDNVKNPENIKLLETVVYCGDTLLTLINDILDFSKLESEKMELDIAPFNLLQSTDQVIELFSTRAVDKEITLKRNINKEVPEWIKGDSIRYRQILTNLISNAIKFTEGGTVEIMLSCLSLRQDNVEIQLSVKDSGIGMSEEESNKLFTPFTQADSSISSNYGGTGLGLAISKSLVELMGGDIWVESKKDEGSIFYVTFSTTVAVANKENKISNLKKLFNRNLATANPMDILLADDNKVNLLVTSKLLEKLGYNADFASNGFEVLERIKEKRYDLVLMDCNMPEMNGFEAANMIIKKYGLQRPRIVALTASAMREDRDKCFAAGMDDFISKPIDIKELVRIILGTKTLDTSVGIVKTFQSFNKTTLFDFFGNDQHIFEKASQEFINGVDQYIINIEKAIKEKNGNELEFSAHALKGAVSNFFAEEILDILLELEEMGSKNKFDKSDYLFNLLKEKIEILKEDLLNLNMESAA